LARVSKQLICPVCGQVMATALWRALRGLQITMPGGWVLMPGNDALLLQIAQQHLASAAADDRPEAQRRLDLILRNAGDRFYDIKCPRGHYTLKTAPEITKAIRTTAGDQVTLS
jgi:ribosomal protein S27E